MDNQRLGKGLSFLMGEDFLGQNSQNIPKTQRKKFNLFQLII